ncbi:hypothetical protein OHB93_09815 [Microbacterium sp. No. 7]|uniref:hypothetical protein n=1 Tax=Microbacterium sp. No. 7 TaxID=1714373 RepID=UPI00300926CA
MHLNKRALLIAATTAALVLAGPAAAQAQPVEDPVSPSAVATLVAGDPAMEYVSINEAEEAYGFDARAEESDPASSDEPIFMPLWSWWGCDWHGQADYPHKTNGEASVHGYWVKDGGDCPTTGTVTAELQALACSSLYGCTWITQASHTVEGVKPGSGTGKWATPHKRCASSSVVGWRGRVDTALTDFFDPFGWDYGVKKDVACSPA